jgi:hypothetical protein
MAKAAQPLALLSWPAEGRTLGEIIELLVGPDAWLLLTGYTGDRMPRAGEAYLPSLIYLTPDVATWPDAANHRPYVEAIEACLQLLDRWNAGALIAKGRRGGRLEPHVEIVPPGTNPDWQVAIRSLTRSTICDPDRPQDIFDVRFMPPATPQPKQLKTKPWIIAAVERRRAADDLPDTITEFSTQLRTK